MAIKVAVKHHTRYRFDRLVNVGPHIVRLRPAPHCRTPIQAYSLKIEPAGHFINWQQDPFGNYLARLVFPEKAKSLAIDVELIADMTVINPFDFFLEESAQHYPFKYEPRLAADLAPYLEIAEDGALLKQWLGKVDRSRMITVDFLVAVNQRLQKDIAYNIRMEPGVQSCEQTLQTQSGSCRDSAWLLVQIFRHLGLAARFVSGYLVQLTADVKALDGPSGPEKDFTDLHAWTEVYIPGAGWVGLDPTSGLFAAEGHIPLACTPEPLSAAPVSGVTDRCEVTFEFYNQVTRIHEDPRVTSPFSATQWQSVMTLGETVDRELQQQDVRLTMGGEPTFVSIDDMEGAEWNNAALGEKKRELAGKLLLQLREHFARGGLIHIGQGKWYPGEPLPRWALSLYWREDGLALWQDKRWLADGAGDNGFNLKHAEQFSHALAQELGLDTACIVPGYEDVYYYLWKEGTLPENVDPLDSKLADPLERKRLRALFERGLDKPAGFALPLERGDERWRSNVWKFKRERMYLLPGDSPLGLRLPLSSLLWQPPEQRELKAERDPFDVRQPLTQKAPTGKAQSVKKQPLSAQHNKARAESFISTALCVEARNGRLYIFLPPLTQLEQFVELIAQIEAVAARLQMPVILEGYEPPRDPRLRKLQVTPDPGVIEVNIHPAHDWKQLVHIIETVYESARQTRLGTEKFMLDGRHTGTGGGNHVTLGGATPADSPFLRRPDLLGSLLTFWQNHPSLSYLFSGMFIGPTSQAPRVDEARDDNLYELEIALQQLPKGETQHFWKADRILRNFLVDLTGNTHRAEFCIDKLYSPDSPTGRLGLVEFRNFEMPPHPQMGAVQMLLLRALTAHFWKTPYPGKPIRWGSGLHDRFMLPHYVWQDFSGVIEFLKDAGYPFRLDWFASFFEFRFPRYGTINAGPVQLELRAAIEPWHVLGEESASQGTARYVDSSVERVQIRAQNLTGERYIIACNGRRVPLHTAGNPGEYVGGVRYKAWQPYSALHPTISAQAPLVFDVVDTRNRRSIGGCTYHVAHPGGRSYETFPVNANEAEARRVARFWPFGHTQDEADVVDEPVHPERPYTLDLRYKP